MRVEPANDKEYLPPLTFLTSQKLYAHHVELTIVDVHSFQNNFTKSSLYMKRNIKKIPIFVPHI